MRTMSLFCVGRIRPGLVSLVFFLLNGAGYSALAFLAQPVSRGPFCSPASPLVAHFSSRRGLCASARTPRTAFVHGIFASAPAAAGTPMAETTRQERACGLGLTILPDPSGGDGPPKMVVMAVSPYSFAKQAGCRVGDVLIKLDGEDCRGITLPTLFEKLVGAVDSPVVLLLQTPNKQE